MKLRNLFFALLTGFAIVSCNDSVIGEENGILKNETTSFVRISLMNPSAVDGTRAIEEVDYEAGSADENKVREILLVFFDAGRNYVGNSTVIIKDDPGVNAPGNGEGQTVERILTTVAQVDLPGNINVPKYLIAYVNPTTQKSDLATDKLEEVMTYIRKRESVSANGLRTMNNSVYFQEETGFIRFATEVDFKTQFFSSRQAAENAENANIDIYVERMEAKVRLKDFDNITEKVNEFKEQEKTSEDGSTPTKTKVESVDGEKKYSLKFVPEAWFVNGTEKRTFLLKNYRSTEKNYFTSQNVADFDEGDYGRNLKKIKAAFSQPSSDGRENEVNSASNFRSFWAIDPTYFNIEEENQDIYPDVSYDVKYNGVNQTNGKVYNLEYHSYSAMVQKFKAAQSTSYVKFDENKKKICEYVLENTMSRNTLQGSDAKASMTSVVLLGHYIIEDKDGNEVFNGRETNREKEFYVRHESNGDKYILLSDEEAIDFFIERSGSTFFVKEYNTEGKETGNYIPLRAAHLKDGNATLYGVTHNDFKLKYPSPNLTLTDKIYSEQWRTLTLNVNNNGVPNQNIFIYDFEMKDEGGNVVGGYRNITKNDITTLEYRMYSAFGVIERFESGKAYFNVPLKHIWGAKNTSNKFDGNTVRLGDYGVVRNHVYELTINSISGLGTGIGDLDQPIVPPTDTDQYYINARLNILKWRIVGQTIDL